MIYWMSSNQVYFNFIWKRKKRKLGKVFNNNSVGHPSIHPPISKYNLYGWIFKFLWQTLQCSEFRVWRGRQKRVKHLKVKIMIYYNIISIQFVTTCGPIHWQGGMFSVISQKCHVIQINRSPHQYLLAHIANMFWQTNYVKVRVLSNLVASFVTTMTSLMSRFTY